MDLDRTSVDSRKRFIFDGIYQILSTVGHGRTSIVYKARCLPDASTKRPLDNLIVALKVFTGNSKEPEKNVERMKREALAMLSSRHSNVIRLNDSVGSDEFCYLCMEYAHRGDLAAELQRQSRPFAPEVVIRLTNQILTGLEAIHQAGILHRDIKPDNLLLTLDGQIKIADFGIAVLPNEDLSAEDLRKGIGTLDYLAPELLMSGESSTSSDLYSVAVTMYEMLCKQLPFAGNSFTQQINKKMTGERTLLTEQLGKELRGFDGFFEIALATEPRNRFRSVAEFRNSLLSLSRKAAPAETELEKPLSVERKRSVSPTRERSNTETYLAPVNFLTNLAPIESQPEEHRVLASLPNLDLRTIDFRSLIRKAYAKAPDVLDRIFQVARIGFRHFQALSIRQRLAVASVPVFLVLAVIALRVMDSSSAIASPDGSPTSKGLNHELSIVDRAKALLGLARVSTSAPSASFSVNSAHSGELYDLLSDEGHVPLATYGITPEQILVIVGIPGWVPQVIDAASFESGDEVQLMGGGLTLSLWASQSAGSAEKVLGGRYKETHSGREGSWVLTK